MNITEFAKKAKLTPQAIYYQIRKGVGYGRYFKRNHAGKWEIDARRVRVK